MSREDVKRENVRRCPALSPVTGGRCEMDAEHHEHHEHQAGYLIHSWIVSEQLVVSGNRAASVTDAHGQTWSVGPNFAEPEMP